MAKWFVGILASVISGVAVWWLTVGLQPYLRSGMTAPPPYNQVAPGQPAPVIYGPSKPPAPATPRQSVGSEPFTKPCPENAATISPGGSKTPLTAASVEPCLSNPK